ncbi:MAG: DUF2269 domain-containing protein [Hyphomicrobium sp.]|nr:DUF2269 domain-containing protein [Hyphomicrobium sp.]
MLYSVLKFLHVAGVVLLIGNVTITAFWKVYSDRSNDPRIVANAQRAVIAADWLFTFPAITLIIVGGYGMALIANMDLFADPWLVWGQVLFLISGALWLGVLVPVQIRQARAARIFEPDAPIPESYWRDGRRWLVWGIAATVPLVAATYVMIAK